jgi:hypothetical protein
MLTQIDQAASRGVNSSWTRRCELSNTADATPGGAKSATHPRKTPKTAYATPSVGASAATPLPRRNSSRRPFRVTYAKRNHG